MTDRVLVTGATGFIAQHCMLQLLEAGYEVRGTARSANRAADVVAILSPHLSDATRSRSSRPISLATTVGAVPSRAAAS
jgi:dihydroflavonol-4-reductase